MRDNVKRSLTWALKLGVTTLALWWVFRNVEREEVVSLLRNSEWGWFIITFLLLNLSQVISGYRNLGLYQCLGVELSPWMAIKLYYVGMFYNLFLPGGIGGDGYKVYWLQKQYKSGVKKLSASVLIDRMCGMLALGVLLLGLASFLPKDIWPHPAAIWVGPTLLIAGIFGFFFIYYRWFPSFKPALWRSVGLSFVIQVLQVISVLFILQALGIFDKALSYLVVFLGSSIMAVIPITIGGFGAREVFMVYAVELLPIDKGEAVALTLSFFMIAVASSLIGGLVRLPKPKPEPVVTT
ncbi:MAG TPA: TIGR00374 family protein [Cytophagales bacterium]|nr:TIGR00374 family protein [Cytophagales bacterium]HAA22593.1 TIGR00374 family protein [Cytophagales bacterium]HAP63540.1 TIGR00374 family protein [Cytophagales bacterium]